MADAAPAPAPPAAPEAGPSTSPAPPPAPAHPDGDGDAQMTNGDADDKPEEEPLPEGATEVLYINNLNERIKLPSPSPPSPLEPILERPALSPEPSPQS